MMKFLKFSLLQHSDLWVCTISHTSCKDFVLDTKRLERFSMRQCLALVLKVKPFKIFTAIHNAINWVGSEGTHFNQ